MKLSKYIHSCILLEEDGDSLLIDPGTFTFSQGVSVETFKDVPTIIITHNHPDHFDIEAVKTLAEGNPNLRIITNGEVREVLSDAGVAVEVITEEVYRTKAFTVEAIPAGHEPLLANALPHNRAYRINGTVLVTGDSYAQGLTLEENIDILLLPISAPWGTELAAFNFAKEVAPKRVVPVHDGYLKDFFQERRYDNYRAFFEQAGIGFEPLKNPGDSIEC